MKPNSVGRGPKMKLYWSWLTIIMWSSNQAGRQKERLHHRHVDEEAKLGRKSSSQAAWPKYSRFVRDQVEFLFLNTEPKVKADKFWSCVRPNWEGIVPLIRLLLIHLLKYSNRGWLESKQKNMRWFQVLQILQLGELSKLGWNGTHEIRIGLQAPKARGNEWRERTNETKKERTKHIGQIGETS